MMEKMCGKACKTGINDIVFNMFHNNGSDRDNLNFTAKIFFCLKNLTNEKKQHVSLRIRREPLFCEKEVMNI